MTDKVEEELSRVLKEARRLDDPDGFLKSVTHAASRRQRSGRVVASIVAVCVLAVVSGVALRLNASSTGKPQHVSELTGHGNNVPWARLAPVPAARSARAKRAATAQDLPNCTPGDLTTRLVSRNPAMGGQVTQIIGFTNSGSEACELSGSPESVTAASNAGGDLSTINTASIDDDTFGLTTPADLQPGQTASLPVISINNCSNPPTTFAEMGFELPAGGDVTLTLPSDETISSACPPEIGQFGVTAPPVFSSPAHVLTASASYPTSVVAGGTALYTITLTNPTSSAVSLDPCPSYSEFLSARGVLPSATELTYSLNCADVGEVAANGSVTFDMQIPVPQTTGPAKYGWTLNGAALQTGGLIQVTSADGS